MNKIKYIIITLLLVVGSAISGFSQTYLISQGGTVNTCSGTLYDSGGASGEYSINEDYTITICSDEAGSSLILLFTAFNTESGYDNLDIHDGPTAASSSIITDADGTDLLGMEIQASGDCLTLVWHSDGSVTNPGFAAEISCSFPCQDYTISIANSDPPLTEPDSLWIDVCQGEAVTFTALGVYNNNNIDYNQTDANTTWTWSVISEFAQEDFTGVGLNEMTYVFSDEGGYHLNLIATDVNGCTMPITDPWRVRVSITPDFVGTFADQTEICPGEVVNFIGVPNVDPWALIIPEMEFVDVCFEDVVGIDQEACFMHSAFAAGQTITDGNDVESICMNMEHSYIGDLDIWIECPNGNTVSLHEYPTCSGTYFGYPDHADDCAPGEGLNYCWTMSAPSSIASNCNSGSTLPAGDYLPVESYDELIGCPLNGEWCIHFLDNLNQDDGTVFTVELHFADYMIPSDDNSFSFVTEYDTSAGSTDIVWTGDGMESNTGGVALAHPATPGDQAFTFTATDNFGCTYDTTVYVHVLPLDDPDCCDIPIPEAGDDSSICGPSYNLSGVATSGNTVNWSMVSGPGNVTWANQTSTNATATVDAFGDYTFELYEENFSPACSATDQITITFYPIPNVQFGYTQIPCYGDTTVITYMGNATSTANYTWGFDGAMVLSGSGQGPYELIYNAAGQFQVTLSVEENGCLSNDTVVTIASPEELTFTLTLEDDPCFESCNGSAFLDADGGTGSYTYSWASGNNLNPNLCADDYTVTLTDENACSVSESFTINQPAEIIVTNTSSTDVTCFAADNGTMSITAQGGTGILTYTWTLFGEIGPIVTDVPAGNYVVTITDENDCSTTQDFLILQPDELLITISEDVAICQYSETIILTTHLGGTSPYSFYWSDGGDFFIGPENLNVDPDITTTYSLYVQDANGCVTDVETMTVTVSPELIIDSLLLQDNRCYASCDGRAELQMLGGIMPLQYSWGSDTYIYEGLCAGLYTVTVSDLINCTTSQTFVIQEPDSITYTYEMIPASCYGYEDGQISIFVEGGTTPYSYIWPNSDQDSVMINGAGLYYVTVEDDHNCRIEVPIAITEPQRILVQTTSNTEICITQEVGISAQATGGNPYYSFYWAGNDGSEYLTSEINVFPDTTTYYSVTVTDSHGCIGNIETVTISVLPPLEILSVVTSYDTVCPRDPAIVEVDAIGGNGGPYLMMLQDGSVVPSPFTVYPMETTMYYITLTDVCGTPSVMDSILINVYPEPPNVFVADVTTGCAPTTINFSELSPNLNQTYLWSFGDNGFDVVKNPAHIYEDAGVFSVQLTTRSPFGCLNSETFYHMITIYEKPYANFFTNPESVSILDAEIEYINVSEFADISYWFFGDGDSSLLTNPRHQYPDIGSYEIMLIVESSNNCRDTAYRNITVNSEFAFYAPTSFTPNGDGTNDCFRICGNGIDPNEFHISIYDRWGTKVFETEVYKPNVNCKACTDGAWDGTNKGDVSKGDLVLENGVYAWYCEFKDWNGIVFKRQGIITMVR